MAADEVKIITVLGKKVIAVKDYGGCETGELGCTFWPGCTKDGTTDPACSDHSQSTMFIEPYQYTEYLTQLLLR